MTNAALRKPPITEEDIAGEETHGKADPAQTSIDIAANQMEALVNGTHDAITGPASRLRDRIDGVIRNTTKRRDYLLAEVGRFRDDGNSAVKTVEIMADGCDKLIEHMGEDMPETVTQFAPRNARLQQR